VVGYSHGVKGQGICAYLTLEAGVEPTEQQPRRELIAHLRSEIGPISSPDLIQWAPYVPRTRSGKVMRCLLRKIAEGDHDNLGDVSTLADPLVVGDLVEHRAEQ
jgi:acetyl-CoA synthetase